MGECDVYFFRKRESDIALRIASCYKAGDARRNITFATLFFPIAHNVVFAIYGYSATFPFSLMLDQMAVSISSRYYWFSYVFCVLFMTRIKYGMFSFQDWPLFCLAAILLSVIIYWIKIENIKIIEWMMKKNYIIVQVLIVISIFITLYAIANVTGIRDRYLLCTSEMKWVY